MASPAPSAIHTFLIADVRGYTRFTVEQGDEAGAHLALRFADLTREVVEMRGGRVIELRGDEALAVFPSAREALRAAVDLQARFAEEMKTDPTLPLRVGIGLDAGEAVQVEGGFRGGALNLAARLCSLAGPGEVLATEALVHLARKAQGLEYREREPVHLKGFADPVRVIQVVPAAENREPEASVRAPAERSLPVGGFLGALPAGPLVSRDEELRRILQAVEAVTGGEGRLVLLAGEPGIGKTRLAQEVMLAARERGFLVATGRCYETRQTVPYVPFLEALSTLHEACSPGLRSDVLRLWPSLGRLLPSLHLSQPDRAWSAQEEQQRLFWAVAAFVQAVAGEKQVALLLDDLHWTDHASLDLLQHLARQTRASPVLLLGTFRDVEVGKAGTLRVPLERALLDFHREQLAETVKLGQLSVEGTAALMAAALGAENVSADLARHVHRSTEGNPFFVQEVLRALIERGDMYRENGTWGYRSLQEMVVPGSVRSVIVHRVLRLHDRVQEVLHQASVLGQAFAFDDLQAMDGLVEQELEEALEEAIGAGLLRQEGEENFAFDHALTQQALYGELPPRRRRRLHLAAGEALEQTSLARRRPEGNRRAAELAWHFKQGGDLGRALPYAVEAGDQAEAVFAHAEAARHYREALDLLRQVEENGSREAGILEKLGTVLYHLGRDAEALEVLAQAAQRCMEAGELEAEGRVVARMGSVHFWRGTWDEGIPRVRATLERFERGGHGVDHPSPALFSLYEALATLLSTGGQFREALEAARRSVTLARAMNDDAMLPRAEQRHAATLFLLGQLDEATRALERVIPLAEAAGDLDILCRALNNLGHIYFNQGKFDKAKACWDRYLAVAQRINSPRRIAFASLYLGHDAWRRASWDEALRFYEQAANILRQVGRSRNGEGPVNPAAVRLLRGEEELALRDLEECVATAERTHDDVLLVAAHRWLAEYDLVQGRAEAVRARLEPLLDLLRPELNDPRPFEVLLTLASAYLEPGADSEDTQRAEDLVQQALTRAARVHSQLRLVQALPVQAMVLAQQGRWPEAQRRVNEALTLAQRLPYPLGEALALETAGMMNLRKGETDQARTFLEQALALFGRLGVGLYRARTKRLLR